MAKAAAKRDPAKERQMLLDALRAALGGEPHVYRGRGGLFAGGKATEAPAEEAVENGYFEKADPPEGEKETKTKQFYRITAKGRQLIFDEDDPKKAIEALKPAVLTMGDRLVTVAEEVQSLTSKLNAMVDALAEMRDYINEVGENAPAPEPREASPSEAPKEADTPTILEQPSDEPAHDFERVLREAYETLRLYVEYQDGIVELPQLYREMRKTMPDLSVETFKSEVHRLWDRQLVELKILNEVTEAKEPEKGIETNDALYYFLMWR